MMTFNFNKLVSALSSDSKAPVKTVNTPTGHDQPTGCVIFPSIQVNGAPSLLEPPPIDSPRREMSAREARLGALIREQALEIEALQREVSRLRALAHHTVPPQLVVTTVPTGFPPAYPSVADRIAVPAKAIYCVHKPTLPTPAIKALSTSPTSQYAGRVNGPLKSSITFGPRPHPPRTRSAPTPTQQTSRPSNIQSCVRAHTPLGSPTVKLTGAPKVVRFATKVQTESFIL